MHDTGLKDARGLDFRQGYAADRALRRSLIDLIASVVAGFEVEMFELLGFWDPTFTPFSFFDRLTCVANVAVFDLPLVVGGRAMFAGGVQLVATHPAYRGRGLFRALMRRAIAYCDDHYEAALLFTSVPALYARFGFRTVSDDVFVVRQLPAAMGSGSTRPLHAERNEDVRLLNTLVSNREPVSRVLGVPAHRPTFFYNELRHRLTRVQHAEELDAALVWDVQGQTLRLLDVVARRMPTLAELAPFLPPAPSVEIWFTPDKLDVECDVRPRAFDDVLMVRGAWPIEQSSYGFPPTAYF